jgi:hypothetical protein
VLLKALMNKRDPLPDRPGLEEHSSFRRSPAASLDPAGPIEFPINRSRPANLIWAREHRKGRRVSIKGMDSGREGTFMSKEIIIAEGE